jgi:asparagine synthase (glutamine-hydrolysing)
MSAIFGALLGPAASGGEALLERMQAALAGRPAEAREHAALGPCLLGVAARGFTPQARGARPLYVAPDGLACVGDLRLDRRAALVAELGLAGSADGEDALSDEALVVAAYRRWGSGFAARLLGDFALALWDPRAQSLLLVRDAYGVRALYYADGEAGLLFASQQRALLVEGGVRPALAPLRLAQYLARDFGDLEHTFFAELRRLPPGHLLRVTREQRSLECYFVLDARRRLPAHSSSEYAAQFRELFVDAVRERARSQGPLGCMLSGGLDSSGLLGALRTLRPGRDVACFSARFPGWPEIDEGEWLRLLQARGGVALTELAVDTLGPLDDIERLHAALDEPFHAPNLFIYDRLAQLARDAGCQVLLDGLDGDSVVEHGFLFLNQLLRGGRLRRLLRELAALRRRTGIGVGRWIADWVFGPELERARAQLGRLGLGGFGYLSREFRRESGFDAYLLRKLDAALSAPRDYRSQHQAALSAPIMAFYLEVHDKLAAAHGVDHRHPYFDRRLIEFCLALPPEQRLFDGWDRVVQRRAFAGLVPEEIRSRQSKSVWSENFERQLFTRHGELLRHVIESDATPLRGLCDLPRLRRDLRRLSQRRGGAGVLDLWCAVTLGLWLEQRGTHP